MCVFLGTFSQILIHYLIRLIFAIIFFFKNVQRRRRGRSLFETAVEIPVNGDSRDGRLTELCVSAGDNVSSPGSLDTRDEDERDVNELGNILINASVG